MRGLSPGLGITKECTVDNRDDESMNIMLLVSPTKFKFGQYCKYGMEQ
jgi:hypothetical protein